jgi:hypothetical protein
MPTGETFLKDSARPSLFAGGSFLNNVRNAARAAGSEIWSAIVDGLRFWVVIFASMSCAASDTAPEEIAQLRGTTGTFHRTLVPERVLGKDFARIADIQRQ